MSQAKYHMYDKMLHLKCDVRGTSATTYLEVNNSKPPV